MNKLHEILMDVTVGVRQEMEKAILRGAKGMHYEKVYGDAYIDVDIFLEYKNNYVFEKKDVMVSHVDTKHKSPLLESAIAKVMPSWFKMFDNIMEEEMMQSA